MRLPHRALLAAGLAILALWPTWPQLLHVWRAAADYRWSPLAALIALVWLVLAARKIPDTGAEPQSSREPPLWSLGVALALAVITWLIACNARIEIGKQIMVPIILWLAIATGASWRAAVSLSAPILYLYFAIPIWEQIVPLLQWLSVAAVRGALGVAGIPVRIEGVLVTIPEGSFIVQEGCSGRSYLIVSLASAGLICGLRSIRGRRALAYLALTTLLALFANWVRVTIVIVAGHLTHMQSYLVANEHLSLGWAIFVVLLGALFALGRKLAGDVSVVAATRPSALPGPASPSALSGTASPSAASPAFSLDAPAPAPRSGRSPAWRMALVAALLSLCSFAVLPIARAPSRSLLSVAVPQAGPAWRGQTTLTGAWTPTFLGSTSQGHGAYESDSGAHVETYWALYGSQDQDKLVHYTNHLTTRGWLTLAQSASQRLLNGQAVTVRTILAQTRDGSRWLIDYYYVVGGVRVTRDWAAQLLYGLLSWRRPAASGVIALAAPCRPACESADRWLSQWWAESRSGPTLAK